MKKTVLVVTLSLLWMISQAQKKSTQAVSVMSLGKTIYEKHCKTCHQADGSGAPNMIPQLVKSDIVLGDKTRLIKILLNGLKGEIKVNGDIYAGEMPAQDSLKTNEMAAVLTYVRKSFGNNASTISSTEVKRVRSSNKKTGS